MLVRKTDHTGAEKTRYVASFVAQDAHKITVETTWPNFEVNTPYGLVINPDDALLEEFWLDDWFNIMAVYGPRVNGQIAPDTLKGWYCNITRPTTLTTDAAGEVADLEWQDLALDVWMDAAGNMQVLDEDEFADIRPDLTAAEVASARGAVPRCAALCHERWRAHMNNRIAGALLQRNWAVATAESCTGGLIGDVLTNRSGCSAYFMGGVISYDNRIKRDVLGVPEDILNGDGAVSEACALAMARGVRRVMDVQVGISATGIAGPGGATPNKPVGLVYLGLSTPLGEHVRRCVWPHDRAGNKRASADEALHMLLTTLG